MVKRLITVWLSLTMLLFSSVSIYAYADSTDSTNTSVCGEYLLSDIVIDGQNILNYKLIDPIVAYNNYIYIPMDENIGNLLGISAVLDTGSRTVYITPKEKQWVDFCQGSAMNNLDDLSMVPTTYQVSVASDGNPDGVLLDLTDRPVLMYDRTVYVPLNAIIDSGVFGWSLCWNFWSGSMISTDPYDSAYNHFDSAKASYKAGLTNYIMWKNPSVDLYKAQKMVEHFETYGEMYGGLDEELLIAIAETESCFYENVRNASSATGLMQIKPFVAAPYGFTAEQLLQSKHNIHMACILLNYHMNSFSGDVSLALSAYACGEYAVRKGNYTLKYYNNWIQKYFNILEFASSFSA